MSEHLHIQIYTDTGKPPEELCHHVETLGALLVFNARSSMEVARATTTGALDRRG